MAKLVPQVEGYGRTPMTIVQVLRAFEHSIGKELRDFGLSDK